jgi:two-component system, chemotaxis family, chemotaxis protein CheY
MGSKDTLRSVTGRPANSRRIVPFSIASPCNCYAIIRVQSVRVSAGDPLVLVVEDDASIRDVIGDVLSDRGYRIANAANGAEALNLLEAHDPDVMVLDLLMPVMHGWEFMESYSEKTGGRQIPIVVVSVNSALPRSFNRFGVREIVAKPFDIDQLVEAVESATGSLTT